ncbi:hypothetical protein CYMTET_4271 [Cymbomonas tetramitiformis]|uniref:Uncharacterized protein n=1 Tax=Cymbomonas tetramitiformis TaxID=36881 RepID=A0AAE0LK90_9CHLO|nr:hypothetical protein CYMTET_4271 [Cymbomonas tetramitiformis]
MSDSENNENPPEVEDFNSLGGLNSFVPYSNAQVTARCPAAPDHPDAVVETASFAGVSTPQINCEHNLSNEVRAARLSRVQLEAILYAKQRHETRLEDGARAGFFLGDSAGVGKGRTLAGMALEHTRGGGRFILWLSMSTGLQEDAKRDLKDLGDEAESIPLRPLPKTALTPLRPTPGIIFCTYAMLQTGSGKVEAAQGGDIIKAIICPGSRLRQLVDWLKKERAEAPLIIFDECHKAKNLLPDQQQPSKTALAVVALQKVLPNARVVYSSATGASEPKNLGYMTRLGTFQFDNMIDLLKTLDQAGMGAMEVFALGLRSVGAYSCRSLSYAGAEFEMSEMPLDPSVRQMYDDSAEFWQLLLRIFSRICDAGRMADEKGEYAVKVNLAQLWGAHQRFFRAMLMCAKVPSVVKAAREAIDSRDMCVVIGLQSTGEACMKRAEADAASDKEASDKEASDKEVSVPKEVLKDLVNKLVPTFLEDNFDFDFDEAEFEKLHADLRDCREAWRQRRAPTATSSTAANGGAAAAAAPRLQPMPAPPRAAHGPAPEMQEQSMDDVECVGEKSFEEVEQEKLERAKRTGTFLDMSGVEREEWQQKVRGQSAGMAAEVPRGEAAQAAECNGSRKLDSAAATLPTESSPVAFSKVDRLRGATEVKADPAQQCGTVATVVSMEAEAAPAGGSADEPSMGEVQAHEAKLERRAKSITSRKQLSIEIAFAMQSNAYVDLTGNPDDEAPNLKGSAVSAAAPPSPHGATWHSSQAQIGEATAPAVEDQQASASCMPSSADVPRCSAQEAEDVATPDPATNKRKGLNLPSEWSEWRVVVRENTKRPKTCSRSNELEVKSQPPSGECIDLTGNSDDVAPDMKGSAAAAAPPSPHGALLPTTPSKDDPRPRQVIRDTTPPGPRGATRPTRACASASRLSYAEADDDMDDEVDDDVDDEVDDDVDDDVIYNMDDDMDGNVDGNMDGDKVEDVDDEDDEDGRIRLRRKRPRNQQRQQRVGINTGGIGARLLGGGAAHPPGGGAGPRQQDEEEVVLRPSPALAAIKGLLLELVEILDLPKNPLDDLIDQLGGPSQVAELTGRKSQLSVRRATPGAASSAASGGREVVRQARGSDANLSESRAFQEGTKLVAIISEAFSTGTSLHAERRAANQRRRLHITLELPWSADKAIQQFGRTHRSNQSTAPVYMLVITDAGGERRFASAVARRLQSQGAILKADRNAMGAGTDLKAFDLDNKYGTKALGILLKDLRPERIWDPPRPELPAGVYAPTIPGGGCYREHISAALNGVDIQCVNSIGNQAEAVSVSKFLNRLLGLRLDDQKLIFDHFAQLFDACTQLAKREGEYRDGVEEVGFNNLKKVHMLPGYPKTVDECPTSGAVTELVGLKTDRGMSFAEAVEQLESSRRALTAKDQKAWEAYKLRRLRIDVPHHEQLEGPLSELELQRQKDAFFKGRDARNADTAFYLHNEQNIAGTGCGLVLLATEKPGIHSRDHSSRAMNIYRPNNSCTQGMTLSMLKKNSRYSRVSAEDARRAWDMWYTRCDLPLGKEMIHGMVSRNETMFLFTGAILPVWKRLIEYSNRHGGPCAETCRCYRGEDYGGEEMDRLARGTENDAASRRMAKDQMVTRRIQLADGRRITGLYPGNAIVLPHKKTGQTKIDDLLRFINANR